MKAKTKKEARGPKPRATSVALLKMGDEPVLSNPSNLELIKAFNWFSACTDPVKLRAWTVTYMQKRGVFNKDQIAEMKSRGKKFNPTMAALARMRCNGSVLEAKRDQQLIDAINSFLTCALDEDDEAQEAAPKKQRRDRTAQIAAAVAELIESHVDSLLRGLTTETSIYSQIVAAGCTPAAATALRADFACRLAEMNELRKGKDEQLVEAYSTITVKQQKLLLEFYKNLDNDFSQFSKMKRTASRTARKPRKVNVDKVVARVKYLKESPEYKVASVSPADIIGASALWTFNAKTRVLSYFEAAPDQTLGVKGTTVQGFGTAVCKRLRKPTEFLPGFMKQTKLGKTREYGKVKCKQAAANGRLNKDTVLLQVIK